MEGEKEGDVLRSPRSDVQNGNSAAVIRYLRATPIQLFGDTNPQKDETNADKVIYYSPTALHIFNKDASFLLIRF